MRSKYQIKSQQSVTSFDKKDDFLKKCSFELNETLQKRNRQSDIHYSYDYGKTWNHILNLKNDRQSIQNEKKPQNENRNNSKKGESALEQSSGDSNWFTYLIVIALIIGGVYYFTNKNNQNKVPRTENNQETITPMDSSNGVNLGEPIPNPTSPPTEPNGNSNSEICTDCNGEGSITGCRKSIPFGYELCNGFKHCIKCKGTQYDSQGRVCIDCNGQGLVNCEKCNGSPNSVIYQCPTCEGHKRVRYEVITCDICDGTGKSKYLDANDAPECPACDNTGKYSHKVPD